VLRPPQVFHHGALEGVATPGRVGVPMYRSGDRWARLARSRHLREKLPLDGRRAGRENLPRVLKPGRALRIVQSSSWPRTSAASSPSNMLRRDRRALCLRFLARSPRRPRRCWRNVREVGPWGPGPIKRASVLPLWRPRMTCGQAAAAGDDADRAKQYQHGAADGQWKGGRRARAGRSRRHLRWVRTVAGRSSSRWHPRRSFPVAPMPPAGTGTQRTAPPSLRCPGQGRHDSRRTPSPRRPASTTSRIAA
jgi:hypothetical protein